LADYFDREIWRSTGWGEFREPLDPDSLLNPAPEAIWPGLMSCDLLPLIGNRAGDWLCIKFDGQNRAADVVHWYHGGGDWIPWGGEIAEAIVIDAVTHRLPGYSRRHAVPAEDLRPSAAKHPSESASMLHWALDHFSTSLKQLVFSEIRETELAVGLLENHVGPVAVRCELVVSELAPLDDPDWSKAAEYAAWVTAAAPELAWGWDISGYAAERAGDLKTAVDKYRKGSQCSVFSDQSIRLRTHWTHEQSEKFSVARLKHLRPHEVEGSEYFRALCLPDSRDRRLQTQLYWKREAERADSIGNPNLAHRASFNAAWDVGPDSISGYKELLERIVETAESSHQEARAAVARTHRACLAESYGF